MLHGHIISLSSTVPINDKWVPSVGISEKGVLKIPNCIRFIRNPKFSKRLLLEKEKSIILNSLTYIRQTCVIIKDRPMQTCKNYN